MATATKKIGFVEKTVEVEEVVGVTLELTLDEAQFLCGATGAMSVGTLAYEIYTTMHAALGRPYSGDKYNQGHDLVKNGGKLIH